MEKYLDMWLDGIAKSTSINLDNPTSSVAILFSLRKHEQEIDSYCRQEGRKIASLFEPFEPQTIEQVKHEIEHVKHHIDEMLQLIEKFQSLPKETQEKDIDFMSKKLCTLLDFFGNTAKTTQNNDLASIEEALKSVFQRYEETFKNLKNR